MATPVVLPAAAADTMATRVRDLISRGSKWEPYALAGLPARVRVQNGRVRVMVWATSGLAVTVSVEWTSDTPASAPAPVPVDVGLRLADVFAAFSSCRGVNSAWISTGEDIGIWDTEDLLFCKSTVDAPLVAEPAPEFRTVLAKDRVLLIQSELEEQHVVYTDDNEQRIILGIRRRGRERPAVFFQVLTDDNPVLEFTVDTAITKRMLAIAGNLPVHLEVNKHGVTGVIPHTYALVRLIFMSAPPKARPITPIAVRTANAEIVGSLMEIVD